MEPPRSVPDAGLSVQYLLQTTCNPYRTVPALSGLDPLGLYYFSHYLQAQVPENIV